MKKIPFTHHTVYSSPLGPMLLAASPQGLVGVWFQGQAHGPAWPEPGSPAHASTQALPSTLASPPTSTTHPDPSVLSHTAAWLDRYFQGQPMGELPPLDDRTGTAFQRAVWQALRAIPWGSTHSYGDLARALGRPQAQRAVGAAVGRNPWSVLVPCHRVLGQGGTLTGYAGGLDRKRALLTLEGILPGPSLVTPPLFTPPLFSPPLSPSGTHP